MIKKIYKKYEIIFNVVLFSIFPIAAFYLMEFYEHNPFEEVRFMAGFFNIILFELIAWILYFVTGRAKWALRTVFIVAMVFGLINHYVMLFRSTPFVPWDIFSIGTATSVASNYDFAPTAGVVVVTVIFIALIMLMHFVDFRIKWKFRFRLIPTVLGILALCLFVNALQDEDFQTDNYLYPFLFTPAYMTKVNGMAVTFAMDLKFVAVDKPAGYSRQKAKELLDSYAGTDDNSDAANNTAITDKSDYPNIIVVMDEAFSDLSVLGDFDTNTDYMPFVHSLEKGNENTITGYLNTSVCGGNTADTEFEFLTGNTMAFLPTGSVPYQQFLNGAMPSLASQLGKLGYQTAALHPYYSTGWNRDKVYQYLGFDSEYFRDTGDFPDATLLRGWVDDESAFDKLIELYEEKEEGSPLFAFEVTMQNHGGYSKEYEDLTNEIQFSDAGEDLRSVHQVQIEATEKYLTLIKKTDEAFENLIDYFQDEDEKTIILMFGDHQPAEYITNSVLRVLGEDTATRNDTTDKLKTSYEVPFVMWANYDIEEKEVDAISTNYLSGLLMDTAGLEKTGYQSWLEKLQQQYPVVTANFYQGTDGTFQQWSNEKQSGILNDYAILQYNNLVDKKHRIKNFFADISEKALE